MQTDDLCYMPATEMAQAIRTKRVSPIEVVEAILARIEALNPLLNAYCTVMADQARRAAVEAEAAVMKGEPLGPLHGIPVSIKDVIITKGIRTTWGSKLYEHFIPDEDAPVVERLKQAGAIILGKTNTPEFGWKGVTDNPLFGVTRNPWNPDLTPGGSSGGAGAAVAAGLGPLAVGTDGGGSIRIPSSFSGIFGFKPSFGRVPIYPASLNETLTVIGPMSRTVRDAALMLSVIAGPDERDRHSLPVNGVDYLKALEGEIRGLRVAWSPDLGYAAVDPEVRAITTEAVRVFEDLGCHVEEADPGFDDPEPIWETLVDAALGARLGGSLPEWRDWIDPPLVKIIEEGKTMSAFQLMQASFQRVALWDIVRRFFARYDLLLTPTVAVPPFAVGVEAPVEIAGRRVARRAWFAFTHPFNLTGQPAASVPCGWTKEQLPVGLQIVGRRFDEVTVLKAAAAFEAAASWADRRPCF